MGQFTRPCCDRITGNRFKVKENRFRVNIRKKFFAGKVVRYWNKLPREVVSAPSLEVFEAGMDGVWSNLV